jgi:hypothetical protein
VDDPVGFIAPVRFKELSTYILYVVPASPDIVIDIEELFRKCGELYMRVGAFGAIVSTTIVICEQSVLTLPIVSVRFA